MGRLGVQSCTGKISSHTLSESWQVRARQFSAVRTAWSVSGPLWQTTKHCEYPRSICGRREYPDVPGLFDARFSQYNQPSLSKELQKTWLISLIGLLMVLVGCGIIMWNEGRAVRTSVALEGYMGLYVDFLLSTIEVK